MNNNSFKPFIAAEKSISELTFTAIICGIILAIIFGTVNAYLGLKVGMTISASIPAAVVSMSITRIIMKRDSILETNMVQTIGSAGESLTAGAIFTIPAIFLLSKDMGINEPSILLITLIGITGGILGVMFMIPLRKALIVKEHDTLLYPEGSACADVLLAGEEGGERAKATFTGMLFAGIYKFLEGGIKIIPSKLEFVINKPLKTLIGIDALPALLGVGFIIGKKVAAYMLAGSLLGWIVIIPLIFLIGGYENIPVFPAKISVSSLGVNDVWNYYIRYIGAGAVAFGGFFSLLKSFPLIIETFLDSIRGYNTILNRHSFLRTDLDIPLSTVFIIILTILISICFIPIFNIGILGSLFIVIFGFFFATVSSRIVGLIGNSSNPVSGMTLATLIIAAFIYKIIGRTSVEDILSVLILGSIVCIIIAIAGDTSQDLKTGFLVGATPYKQQIGEIIGILVMSFVLGGILMLFNNAWGFGSTELPAPQATLVKLVVEGVMTGNLPWALIFIGVGIGLLIELLGIPILPVAIGLYLPIHLTTAIYLGGIIRGFVNKNEINSLENKMKADIGILYSSGMVAGEGIVGVILAFFSALGIEISNNFTFGYIGTFVLYSVIIWGLIKHSILKKV